MASGGDRAGGLWTNPSPAERASEVWRVRADVCQAALVANFWDPRRRLFWRDGLPGPRRVRRHAPFWWQAQALAAQFDAAGRGRPGAGRRAQELLGGIARMAGSLTAPDFFDDLAWLGLACAQGHNLGWLPATPARQLLAAVRVGAVPAGGVRWRRGDDFVNVAATAPAGLLALAVANWDDDPFLRAWAAALGDWLHARLVSPTTGLIWDGARPQEGVLVPEGPLWSYNIGLLAGLDLALAGATADPARTRLLREQAVSTLRVGTRALRAGRVDVTLEDSCADSTGVLWRDEGPGDPDLFRGILARHVAQAVRADPGGTLDLRSDLLRQAAAVRRAAPLGLLERRWGAGSPGRRAGSVTLAEQLTAVFVVEAANLVAGGVGEG